MTRRFATLTLCVALIACSPSAPATQPEPSALAATLTPTPAPPSFWIQPGVPESISTPASESLTASGFVQAADANTSSLQIVLDPNPEAVLATEKVYALVAPFPTVVDGVAWAELQSYWQGTSATLTGFDSPPRLMVASELEALLAARLGAAGPNVSFAPHPALRGGGLVEAAWEARPALTIVPFDQLEPRWKVLSVDGQSPLDKQSDMASYPLAFRVGVTASPDYEAQALAALQPGWQATNRDPAKMTVVVLTGTTALTRSTAWFIENNGADFPSLNIRPFFADKDILHVSNEVSFTPRCPPPDPEATEFCSKPEYFDTLRQIDVDIIELTGNHNNDYTIRPTLYTLDMYDQEGVIYYGGGRTVDEAKMPRIIAAPDGTRVAFVGCNFPGPFKALATTETPGAAPCDDWAWIKQTIADLKANGQADVVIATVQYHESQSYSPEKQQVPDFQALADAGADIVSGSQAHVPQTFAVTTNSFIHYGVGNLFFDQMDFIENRQMFADKYILYEGRVISTVLFTGIMEDYSQPRPMTAEERAAFLMTIFTASGW